MSPLIRLLLVNFAGGFVIGLMTGLDFMQATGNIGLVLSHPLEAALILWAFVSSFAVGAIGTGLALLPYE